MSISRSSRSLQLLPTKSTARSRPRVIEKTPVPSAASSTSRTARELWLAIHLPRFQLDALGEIGAALRSSATQANPATLQTNSEAAIAVIDLEHHGGRIVCDCNEAAAAGGVTPGIALNSALALVPQLATLAREPRREKQLLHALAEWAGRFTPRVSLEPPDAVLLEVRGSLRLFGGARRLGTQLHKALVATGLEHSLSLTPTPLASLWLARAGAVHARDVVRHRTELAGRLTSLPLVVTRWPARSLETLATMGVHTVGECLRLPRDGFTRRFEPRLRLELDRALGVVADPRQAFVTTERFVARRELEPEQIDVDRLQPVCESLLGELCECLQERAAAVASVEFRMVHREGRVTRLRLGFAESIASFNRMQGVLRERLVRLQLPEPVRAVRIRSGTLVDEQGRAAELFLQDRRLSSDAMPQLIERLRSRLGNAAVHGLACVAEHRPEAAWKKVELELNARNAGCTATAPSSRPLWLLEAPEPCVDASLQIEEGPECIESGWWDGHDVARDYYVARNARGERLWVFRNRRPTDPVGWFLHGRFG